MFGCLRKKCLLTFLQRVRIHRKSSSIQLGHPIQHIFRTPDLFPMPQHGTVPQSTLSDSNAKSLTYQFCFRIFLTVLIRGNLMLTNQVVGKGAEILPANLAIHVVPQLDVDFRVIQPGVFQSFFPTPERPHPVNAFDQFRVTAFDGGNIERRAARVKPLDFTDDVPLD